MKIGVFETYMPKFMQEVVDKWRADGHEVRHERYYNPDMVRWADTIWFDAADNNLKIATSGETAHGYREDWDMRKMDLSKTQVIVRAIDIEIWYGHHGLSDWNVVDDVIFLAKHIQEKVAKDVDLSNVNQHLIQCGVNLDKFTMQDEHDPFKIAVVARMWRSKGTDHILQILAKLPPEYSVHVLGKYGDYEWERAYHEDFLERNGLKDRFTRIDEVDSVPDFLKGKGTLLSASHKEAFGYNIAEGMAMGLKPVIHNFYGANQIWKGYLWETIDDAVKMITDEAKPRDEYKQYLIDHEYTFKDMIRKFDEVIHA